MTETVKRYDVEECYICPIMEEKPYGDYVEYGDYKKLEAQLAGLSRSAQKVVYSYWNNTDGVITGMYDLEQAVKAARKDQ